MIVGAGGLGSPAALYLAGTGVGRIGLVDGDAVDANNCKTLVCVHVCTISSIFSRHGSWTHTYIYTYIHTYVHTHTHIYIYQVCICTFT